MKTLFSLLIGLISLPLVAQECLDFEDFTSGTTFSGSQESISFNTTFLAQPVVLPSGGTTSGGSVSVGPSIAALSSGQALNINNAAVEICLPGLKQVSFRFTNQGGYFNFSIDGSAVEVPTNDPGSYSVNGVDIVITGTKPNNRLTGEITLTAKNGTFGCFSVGGQELQIDDICFLTCENPSSPDSAVPEIHCVEFEDLEKQGPFPYDSVYLENGLAFKIREYDGAFGQATSSTLRQAGHLGLEFHFENSGFSVGADCWSAVKFHFFTKDPVEVTVNGVTQNAEDIYSLHGLMFGDVAVAIEEDPDNSGGGIACFVGRIENFVISGSNFYVDHFCVADCLSDCIDFEGESSERKYTKNDIISEDGFILTIEDPQGNSTPAQISTDNGALGTGKELQLNEGLVNFGESCFQGLAFQYGQFSNSFTLLVDSSEVSGNRLSELDGTTVAGMAIEVFVTQAAGNWERGVVRLKGAASKIALFAEGMNIDRVCIDECPEPLVVGFGEEPLGEAYEDGDTLGEDDLTFTVCNLRINDDGVATIIGNNQTGGTGQAIALDFASLKFDLLCASELTFQYANFGANGGPQGFGFDVRLVINGESSGLVQNFPALDGTTLGGATINADAGTGRVTITGAIESVLIGGFNIQLDNLMQTPFLGGPQCHNFNTWDPTLTYGTFDENFVSLADGTGAFFLDFEDSGGNFTSGTASIATAQYAGGSGRELTLQNTVVSFLPLLGDWANVSFRFSEAGSASTREVSLEVNGERSIVSRITDLDGQVYRAGTDLEVTATVLSQLQNGKLVGIVKLAGIVSDVYIGGENLIIDDLCGTQQPAPIWIDSWVVSVEQTAPDEITYVWDVEALNAKASDFFIRRSSNLSSFQGYSGSSPTVTSHGLGTNLFRVSKTEPIDQAKRFYRVHLSPF